MNNTYSFVPIRTKEEFEKNKEFINPDLLSNPVFGSLIDKYFLEPLENGKNVSLVISPGDRYVRIADLDTIENDVLQCSDGKMVSIRLNNNGELGVTEEHEVLHDRKDYFEKNPTMWKGDTHTLYRLSMAQSIFCGKYTHLMYDDNGLEVSRHMHTVSAFPTPYKVTDVDEKFKSVIGLNYGSLRCNPSSEWERGSIPQVKVSQNISDDFAVISSAYINRRDDMPLIADVCFVTRNANEEPQVEYQGSVGLDYRNPEKLNYDVVANRGKISELDKTDGLMKPSEIFSKKFPDKSVDEIIEIMANLQMDALEKSELRNNVDNSELAQIQYNALSAAIISNNKVR